MRDLISADVCRVVERVSEETGIAVTVSARKQPFVSSLGLAAYLENQSEDGITIYFDAGPWSKDYGVAHEAARIRRFFMVTETDRYVVSSNLETQLIAYMQMETDVTRLTPQRRTAARSAFPMFYSGLITQIASAPADPWLNAWLFSEYPDLRDTIRSGLTRVVDESSRLLDGRIRSATPATVYDASNAINAQFALFGAELLGDAGLSAPYVGTRYQAMGQELRRQNSSDRGLVGDKQTTRMWGKAHNIDEWYRLLDVPLLKSDTRND